MLDHVAQWSGVPRVIMLDGQRRILPCQYGPASKYRYGACPLELHEKPEILAERKSDGDETDGYDGTCFAENDHRFNLFNVQYQSKARP